MKVFRSEIKTPLGEMVAISDEANLLLLDFSDSKKLQTKLNRFKAFLSDNSMPIEMITEELEKYFHKRIKKFQTPLQISTSDFRKAAWLEMMKIPYGKTISYLQQAKAMSKPKAFRAVANANGYNDFAILIPCHRVIASDGTLGGYSGGLERKKWLLELERNNL